MKILLTGASGLVGSAVASIGARLGHTLIGVTGRFSGPLEGLQSRLALDLASAAAVDDVVRSSRPDAIINAAAISEPAACDAHPELSDALNIALPQRLAERAREIGARLIHLSSEQVFGGDRAPYRCGDPVAPLNRYARQKVASEQAVADAAGPLAATVRAPLLGGNSPGGRRSLHERLLADWAAGKTPRLYTDEIRQVCNADNLATALLELCTRRDLSGNLHWAGTEPLSRYELARRIREHFRLDPARTPMTAITRGDDPAAAASRPADLSLDLSPLVGALQTKPESFAVQLAHLNVPPALQAWVNTSRLPS
jgi:dTDP-4-dehydrorhamnose reductase